MPVRIGGAELAIAVVAEEADVRVSLGRAGHDGRRLVGGRVVDDDDLVRGGVAFERVCGHVERMADVVLLVVHRQDTRNRGPLREERQAGWHRGA